MNKKLKYNIFWVIIIFLLSCSNKNDIIAKVGGKKINFEDVKNNLEENIYNFTSLLKTENGRKKYIESLISAKILELEAERYGIDKDKQVKKRIEDMTNKIIIAELFKKLQDTGEIEPKEEQIKKFYEDNISDYNNPVTIRLSQILLTDKMKLNELKSAISQNVSFENLVKKYSEDIVSKQKNGDIGYIKKGDLLEELEQAAFKLKKIGDISEPVETPFGFHILKITDKKISETIPYEKAYENIKNGLQKKMLDNFVTRAKKNYYIKTYDEILIKNIKKLNL